MFLKFVFWLLNYFVLLSLSTKLTNHDMLMSKIVLTKQCYVVLLSLYSEVLSYKSCWRWFRNLVGKKWGKPQSCLFSETVMIIFYLQCTLWQFTKCTQWRMISVTMTTTWLTILICSRRGYWWHTWQHDAKEVNGSWNYNYLCNHFQSPQTLWVRIPLMPMCTRPNIMW